MSDLIYAHPDDNVVGDAELSLETGTLNAKYPLSRMVDGDPATHTKSTSTDDFRVLFTFDAAQRIDGVWVPMHNIPAGTTIKFEGHTSNAWSSPAFSASYTVPAYYGGLPRGIFIDLTDEAEYSATGWQYWSLFVPDPSQVTAIGEVFLASQLRRVRNLLLGVQTPRDRRVLIHEREDGGDFTYDRGTDLWSASGHIVGKSTVTEAYEALFGATKGRLLPFPIVFDPDDTVPEGLLVKWVTPFAPSLLGASVRAVPVEWRMVGRGRLP